MAARNAQALRCFSEILMTKGSVELTFRHKLLLPDRTVVGRYLANHPKRG